MNFNLVSYHFILFLMRVYAFRFVFPSFLCVYCCPYNHYFVFFFNLITCSREGWHLPCRYCIASTRHLGYIIRFSCKWVKTFFLLVLVVTQDIAWMRIKKFKTHITLSWFLNCWNKNKTWKQLVITSQVKKLKFLYYSKLKKLLLQIV